MGLSCPQPSLKRLIAKLSNTTSPRSINFASNAREESQSERRSKREAFANSNRSSARGSPTPICDGGALRRHFNNSKVVIIGGGKDGLPIILGNVDSPAPMKKALGTPPVEDGTRAGDRVTAATPAVPLERTPAAALSIPAEKMPAVEATPRETAQSAPAAAPPAEPRSLWPLSLSDLETLLSRLLRSTDIISTRQPSGEMTSEQSQ